MSERNWGVFVAAGLIAGGALVLFFLVGIVGLNYCPGSPCKYHESSSEYPPENNQESMRRLPFAFGPNTTDQFGPDDQESAPHYYERQDLRAQESVARATNAIVVLSIISLAVGALGVFSVFATVILSVRAVNAANENNRIQHANQRPWLSIQDIEITRLWMVRWSGDPNFSHTVWMTGRYTMFNSGPTPALRVYPQDVLQAGEMGHLLPDNQEISRFRSGYADLHEMLGYAVPPNGKFENSFTLSKEANLKEALLLTNFTAQIGIIISYIGPDKENRFETFQTFEIGQRAFDKVTFNHFVRIHTGSDLAVEPIAQAAFSATMT